MNANNEKVINKEMPTLYEPVQNDDDSEFDNDDNDDYSVYSTISSNKNILALQ